MNFHVGWLHQPLAVYRPAENAVSPGILMLKTKNTHSDSVVPFYLSDRAWGCPPGRPKVDVVLCQAKRTDCINDDRDLEANIKYDTKSFSLHHLAFSVIGAIVNVFRRFNSAREQTQSSAAVLGPPRRSVKRKDEFR